MLSYTHRFFAALPLVNQKDDNGDEKVICRLKSTYENGQIRKASKNVSAITPELCHMPSCSETLQRNVLNQQNYFSQITDIPEFLRYEFFENYEIQIFWKLWTFQIWFTKLRNFTTSAGHQTDN